jgi:hypothetical protein
MENFYEIRTCEKDLGFVELPCASQHDHVSLTEANVVSLMQLNGP